MWGVLIVSFPNRPNVPRNVPQKLLSNDQIKIFFQDLSEWDFSTRSNDPESLSTSPSTSALRYYVLFNWLCQPNALQRNSQ